MRQSLFLVLLQMHGWLGTALWMECAALCGTATKETLSEARIITDPNSKLR